MIPEKAFIFDTMQCSVCFDYDFRHQGVYPRVGPEVKIKDTFYNWGRVEGNGGKIYMDRDLTKGILWQKVQKSDITENERPSFVNNY